MPAALKKKPAVVDDKSRLAAEAAPAADNPRARLLAAIHADFAARNAVEDKQKAIRAATDKISEAESRLHSAEKAIAKAKQNDADRAAAAITAGREFTAAQTSKAIAAVGEAEHLIEVTTSARSRLRTDLAVLEDNAAAARNDIVVAIKELTLPLAVQLMEELRQTRRRTCICVRVLSELLSDDARMLPVFHDQMRGVRAVKMREGVFAGIKEEANALLFGPSGEDHTLALEASKEMKAALVEMQMNALSPLPKV